MNTITVTATKNNTGYGYADQQITAWPNYPSFPQPSYIPPSPQPQWVPPSPVVSPSPLLNYTVPQITYFGGQVKSMRDLPTTTDMWLTIGLTYFVEDIDALTVWSGSGWVTYMSTPPLTTPNQDEQEASKELVSSKDVTRWPPRD